MASKTLKVRNFLLSFKNPRLSLQPQPEALREIEMPYSDRDIESSPFLEEKFNDVPFNKENAIKLHRSHQRTVIVFAAAIASALFLLVLISFLGPFPHCTYSTLLEGVSDIHFELSSIDLPTYLDDNDFIL